ncbi:hypothetical protein MAR_005085 [Mya arenaria]|uniref:Uncharacterized protein n=1 Tax=Mya arenaria TaxID=6604 RepID=A0ABY7F038_MYAAR|nr:hypothetical protein MAR_005085 [Mya arenaria]
MRNRVTLTSGKKCGTAERRPLTRYARDLAGQITDAEMKPSQDVMIPTVLRIAMSISRHVTDTRRAIATMHVIQAAATRDIMTVRTEEITPTNTSVPPANGYNAIIQETWKL